MFLTLMVSVAHAYTVSFHVAVSALKDDRNGWDPRPVEEPEIMLVIQRGSSVYECESGYRCSTGAMTTDERTFSVSVFDADRQRHDVIGEASCSLSSGQCTVTRGADQLLSIVID